MKKVCIILLLHVILILLASTDFTIISYFRDHASFHCTYGEYAYRNGFGSTYVSNYSFHQVLTYIAAYLSGLVLFAIVSFKGMKITGLLGLGLCGIGLASFLIEGSHWVFQHHLSLIASFPIVLVILWFVTVINLAMKNKRSSKAGEISEEIC